MNKVTSVEFQKKFGIYRKEAHKGAVIITNHGRDDLALISAGEYARLRQLDQQAFYPHELPSEVVDEFGAAPVSKKTQPFDYEHEQA